MFHSSLTLSLNGLFRLTSSVCSKEVKLPGMAATSVLVLDNLASEFSVMCLRRISQTNGLRCFLIIFMYGNMVKSKTCKVNA